MMLIVPSAMLDMQTVMDKEVNVLLALKVLKPLKASTTPLTHSKMDYLPIVLIIAVLSNNAFSFPSYSLPITS